MKRRFAYELINNRSVLKKIDGPLANGPKNDPTDSDITTYEHGPRGAYLVSSTVPGGFKTTYSRDEVGRITTSSLNDGYRRIDTNTTYAGLGSIANEVQSISKVAWLLKESGADQASKQALEESSKLTLNVVTNKRDAAGRVTSMTDAAGRVIEQRYDAAGRIHAMLDGVGHQAQVTFDVEGHAVVAGLYRPGEATPSRASYRWYDEQGRLTKRLLPDGRLDAYTYGRQGELRDWLQSHGEGDDRLHSYRSVNSATSASALSLEQTPDGYLRGQLSALRSASKVAQKDPPKQVVRHQPRLLDDFGQVVAQHLADHGDKVSWFDEAGQRVRLQSAEASELVLGYDAVGRLISKAYKPPGDVKPQVLARYFYEGALLKLVEDEAQQTAYEHDALGRQVGQVVKLKGLEATPAKALTTRTSYDEGTGLINSKTLYDGRVLRIKRGAAQRGATVSEMALQSEWSAKVEVWARATLPQTLADVIVNQLPVAVVAGEMQVDAFDGLKGYTAGNGVKVQKQHDQAGRVTQVQAQGVLSLGYRYGVGPKVRALVTQWQGEQGQQRAYGYEGFGALGPEGATKPSTTDAPRIIKTAAATQATQETKAQRDKLGRLVQDDKHRYTYTASSQVSTISDLKGNATAAYAYNARGERVSKVVGATKTYYLWQDSRVVGEVSEQGEITSQYLYVAEGQAASPVAKLEGPRTYYIHVDQRGVAQAMTDQQQRVVWRASLNEWGLWRTGSGQSNAKPEAKPNEATLNLRLPGQYYDEESGLHDNVHRTYDPAKGSYLQPDPLGYPDGPDAYLYAGGDPVNKMDPLGLYGVEVHYYMTYFLARVAGLTAREAQTMALGTQFIDDNPDTWPLDEDSYFTSGLQIISGAARVRLSTYHFTQVGFDNSRQLGESIAAYSLRRFQISSLNPMLTMLSASALRAPSRCSKMQLYGEFLHGFQDTFSHRDQLNDPINMNAGLGHAIYGHSPDITYNHWGTYPGALGFWGSNEARTLEMERQVLERIRSDFGTTQRASFSQIRSILVEFNRETSNAGKHFILDEAMQAMGFGPLVPYDSILASQNRRQYLCDLQPRDYPGVIFPRERCGKVR